MTACEFFGCALTAFGPALAMLCFTIASDPIRVIILIASAFFWLLSLLLSSILWILLPTAIQLVGGMVISVLFQELFRFFVYKLLRKAENGLRKITENDVELTENKHILAYVAGVGFGLMSGLFAVIDVLADVVGPATVGLHGGSSNFVMVSAAFTLIFTLLHTFWSVIFFAGLDNRNYYYIGWVIVSHLAASSFTLLNSNHWYGASLTACSIITILTCVVAFRSVGGTLLSLKQGLTFF